MAVKILRRRAAHRARRFRMRAMMLLLAAGVTGLVAANARDLTRYRRMRSM
jgi:hypothetical protein